MHMFTARIAAALLALSFFGAAPALAATGRTTDAKLFLLKVELEPAQPLVGINTLTLIVTETGSDRLVEDAVIELVPWMTMHSHGSPKKPVIKKVGAGRYHVENIFYTMEGDWDLLITVQRGGSRDTAAFPVMNVKKK